MIYNQAHEPRNAAIGDAWTDGKSFKRVLSRGRSWENVNLGSQHPDEVDHDEQERKRAEAEQQQPQVPVSESGTGEPAQDVRVDGDDQLAPSGEGSQEPAEVTTPAANESEGAAKPV